MKCERCGKDISWSNYTISIPVELGYEHHKVCSECFNSWNDHIRKTFYEYTIYKTILMNDPRTE